MDSDGGSRLVRGQVTEGRACSIRKLVQLPVQGHVLEPRQCKLERAALACNDAPARLVRRAVCQDRDGPTHPNSHGCVPINLTVRARGGHDLYILRAQGSNGRGAEDYTQHVHRVGPAAIKQPTSELAHVDDRAALHDLQSYLFVQLHAMDLANGGKVLLDERGSRQASGKRPVDQQEVLTDRLREYQLGISGAESKRLLAKHRLPCPQSQQTLLEEEITT
mmetsp:Transcript_91200/g.247318  ORF Transcript_91200/g.247318 Transcript_91200/m.247318 type:complete len:221 (+) Transcript_91200:203-865(+)